MLRLRFWMLSDYYNLPGKMLFFTKRVILLRYVDARMTLTPKLNEWYVEIQGTTNRSLSTMNTIQYSNANTYYIIARPYT